MIHCENKRVTIIIMLDESLHLNLEAVFQEVLRRRKEQAAFDREAYDQFVEDVIDEKLDLGELDDDNNIQEWKEQLQNRWIEVEQMDAEEQDAAEE